MELNEQQYERVAQWLDGQDIVLDDQELAAAEEIRRHERSIAAEMGVRPARRSLERAGRRMAAELARPRRRAMKIGVMSAIAAAVAAIVLIAAMLVSPTERVRLNGNGSDMVTMDTLLDAVWDSAGDSELEQLVGEVDQLESQISNASASLPADWEKMVFDQDLEEF